MKKKDADVEKELKEQEEIDLLAMQASKGDQLVEDIYEECQGAISEEELEDIMTRNGILTSKLLLDALQKRDEAEK